jgi:hypothetical protein
LLPEKLSAIDDTNRGKHHYLADDDRCLYFGEYQIGKPWSAGPTNQLIKNFKRTPQEIREHASGQQFAYYKNRSIAEIANALSNQVAPQRVAQKYTFVPMPTSKIPGDPDHCDRLSRVLQQAFIRPQFNNADIRPLLRQTRSVEPDHLSGGQRIPYDELYDITLVDEAQLDPPVRSHIVLFDDTLVSGKHYSVAKRRIREVLPDVEIIGLFVARGIHPNVADDFEDLGDE